MSDVIIRAENLGKSYHIAHAAPPERYTALRDVLARQARSVWGRFRHPLRRNERAKSDGAEEFWALRDVSFEIKRGDAVGIIGRNGAGKSTLLKILSRITEPTRGRVRLRGRVASLLEVGTGFHPELTGRENIYLNGAILGMARTEITRKFDEIVDFAGVERFLDTPVKRYSSGMYVRLAFAVAAHLEPEILVVDEVLAVGDAEFQKKCLGKMQDVASGGRTVLFVSHNMAAVSALCHYAMVLSHGQIATIAPSDEAVATYHAQTCCSAAGVYEAKGNSDCPHFTRVEVFQPGSSGSQFRMDGPIGVRLEFKRGDTRNLAVGIRIRNSRGVTVIHSSDELLPATQSHAPDVRECILPPYVFAEDNYFVRAGLFLPGSCVIEALEDVVGFEVISGRDRDGRALAGKWQGVIGPALATWSSRHGILPTDQNYQDIHSPRAAVASAMDDIADV